MEVYPSNNVKGGYSVSRNGDNVFIVFPGDMFVYLTSTQEITQIIAADCGFSPALVGRE